MSDTASRPRAEIDPFARRTSSEHVLPVPVIKVRIDVVLRRLQRVHELLSAIPLDALELQCPACGTALQSRGSRLAVDAVLELEDAIELLAHSAAA